MEHADEVCEASCALGHCFARVKINAPAGKGRRSIPVELCVDLHPRLQVGSLRALLGRGTNALEVSRSSVLPAFATLMRLSSEGRAAHQRQVQQERNGLWLCEIGLAAFWSLHETSQMHTCSRCALRHVLSRTAAVAGRMGAAQPWSVVRARRLGATAAEQAARSVCKA